MVMRHFFALCLIALTVRVSADDLSALRANYEKALERAAEPVKATYLEELKKLMDRQTRAGDLDAAIATRTEIQSVSGTPPAKTPGAPSAPAPTTPAAPAPAGNNMAAVDPALQRGERLLRQQLNEIEARFVDKLWIDELREHHTIYFRKDGTATRVIDSRTGKKQEFEWELREDGVVLSRERSFLFPDENTGKWFVPNGNAIDVTNLKLVPGGRDPNAP